MNPETKKQLIVCLKTGWVVAVVAILLMGTAAATSSAEACMEASKVMLFTMFLLTFPISMFSFSFLLPLIDPAFVTEPAEFILSWLVMLIGGLVQWFLIVPNLAQGPELTTLNLDSSPAPAISKTENRTEDTPIVMKADTSESQPPLIPVNLEKESKKRRKRTRPVVPFDRKGRTPIERVIARS